MWCVGDLNIRRRIWGQIGGSRFTTSMMGFKDFIRESDLVNPPLRNASFSWSSLEESLICTRLNRSLFSNDQSFSHGLQETLPN